MSMQDLVRASVFRSKLLKEAEQYELTCIEISYKFDNILAERLVLKANRRARSISIMSAEEEIDIILLK